MLARADPTSSRPDGLAPEFGFHPKGGYRLSEAQAQRILEMQLQRLTGLEQDKIVAEYKEVMEKIVDLLDILANPARITAIISDELDRDQQAVSATSAAARSSSNTQDLSIEDLIAPEDVVVTLSHSGYMKSQPVADYRAQKRGGRGKQATTTKEDDFVEKLFIANTHDYILCFSNRGRVYWLKVYRVPQGGRDSRGKPIINLVPLHRAREDHRGAAGQGVRRRTIRVHGDRQRHGQEDARCRDSRGPAPSGIIAVDLDDGDYLIGVALTDGKQDVMLFSDAGKAVRFAEKRSARDGPQRRAACAACGWRRAAGHFAADRRRRECSRCSRRRKTDTASARRSANTRGTAAARRA